MWPPWNTIRIFHGVATMAWSVFHECLQFLVPVFEERAEEKTSASLTKTSVKLSVSIYLNVASCFRTIVTLRIRK